jgi:hypothetical protein
MIGLHGGCLFNLLHRHQRVFGEQLGSHAAVLRVEMLHQYKGQTTVARHRAEKPFKSVQPAGGRAQPDDRNRRSLIASRGDG